MPNAFLNPSTWSQIAKHHLGAPLLYHGKHVTVSHYQHKMNLFTYFKGQLNLPLKVVGIPCSVSSQGFEATSPEGEAELIKWVRQQKGFTLLLNVDAHHPLPFPHAETLPSFVLDNTFINFEDYLHQFRAHYRYRVKRAMKCFEPVVTQDDIPFHSSLYPLYEAVYNRSKYPLEKLSPEYFASPFAKICAFYVGDQPIAFCQYAFLEGQLHFLFCGLDYVLLKKYDTYYNVLLFLVDKGLRLCAKSIEFGQTTEDIKQKFGCKPIRKTMYLHHANPAIAFVLRRIMPFMGYRLSNEDYHPFHKETTHDHLEPLPKDLR